MTRQPHSTPAHATTPPPPELPGVTGGQGAAIHDGLHGEPAASSRAPKKRKTQAEAVPARTGRLRPWLYGCAGFFFGVVFWHAVGFWGFVSEAVFSGPRQQIARQAPVSPPAAMPATSRIETGAITTGSIHSDTSRPSQSPRNAMSPVRPVTFDRREATRSSSGPAPGVRANEPTSLPAGLTTGTLNCADLVMARATPADLAAAGCMDAASPATTAATIPARPNIGDDTRPALDATLATPAAAGPQVPPLPPRIGGWSTAVRAPN